MRPAQELLQYRGTGGAERLIRNPGVFISNLRFVLLEPLGRRAKNGQIRVDEDLGVDADGSHGMTREHDQIVDSLCALSRGAKFSRGVACPRRAAPLVVVTLGVVDHIVEPEANVDLRWMLRQRDDVADLLEALGKVLMRVVVAMWLRVSGENIAIEAPERPANRRLRADATCEAIG